MKTPIPSFHITIRIEQDHSDQARTEYREYLERFIRSFNETWETSISYQDLIADGKSGEGQMDIRLKSQLESAIEQILQESIEDEFLNGLNFELNQCKYRKEGSP